MDPVKAKDSILAHLPVESPLRKPMWALVCGSGLAGLADALIDSVVIPYSDIHGFAAPTVLGHGSNLAFGYLSEKRIPVVAQTGRFHAYEGKGLDTVTFPMRIFSLLGVQCVLLSNAAGGLNPEFKIPTIVAVHDHISLPSLTSMNPLIGPNKEDFGTRFPATSNAYDYDLRKSVFRAAHKLGLPDDLVTEGTYAWVAGPTFESPAECRFLRAAGADMVGMSTVPEVIVARHCNMRVLVLSLITNKVDNKEYRSAKKAVADELAGKKDADVEDEFATHADVLNVGRQAAETMRALVEETVGESTVS